MAAEIGDVVQLVLTGTYALQTWENVFFYRIADAPTAGYLAGLMTDFQTVVLSEMTNVQNGGVAYTQLYAKNIFNGDEDFAAPLSPTGGTDGGAGESMSSFVAASIKLIRSNARVRHGRKSLVGMGEANAEGQTWISGYVANLQLVADKFATSLNPGVADVFNPVIVKRIEYHPVGTPIDHVAYRLPETQVEMGDNWSIVASAQASPVITTMNSRKQGHGI